MKENKNKTNLGELQKEIENKLKCNLIKKKKIFLFS